MHTPVCVGDVKKWPVVLEPSACLCRYTPTPGRSIFIFIGQTLKQGVVRCVPHYQQHYVGENPSSSSHSGSQHHYLRPTPSGSKPNSGRAHRFPPHSQSKPRRIRLRRCSWRAQTNQVFCMGPCDPPCWTLRSRCVPAPGTTGRKPKACYLSVGEFR